MFAHITSNGELAYDIVIIKTHQSKNLMNYSHFSSFYCRDTYVQNLAYNIHFPLFFFTQKFI